MEAYFLSSTRDTQDRTREIEKMLAEHKVCILGSGVFYTSGITMPEDSTLMGMGACSELILDDQVQEGYAVRLNSRCNVRNLMLRGAPDEADRPTEVGSRHGIGFVGTATQENRSQPQPADAMIHGCYIRCFSGGGITCRDTGYGIHASVCVSDCRIQNCGAGINISRFSEFHKFNNVVSIRNLYGCVNNGGNNVFTGCAFDGNTVGFLIDNSRKQSHNNAHGTCTACTFNHSGGNVGVGIQVLGSSLGYVFSDCQMGFSGIHIENSKCLQFNHFNFGIGVKILVKDGGIVTFDGNIFAEQPEIVTLGEPNVQFHRCYTKLGETVE